MLKNYSLPYDSRSLDDFKNFCHFIVCKACSLVSIVHSIAEGR